MKFFHLSILSVNQSLFFLAMKPNCHRSSCSSNCFIRMIHRNWRSTRYHWTDFSVLKMFLRIIFFPLRFIPMYCYSLRSINSQEATKKTTASTQFVRYVAMLQEQCFIRCTCFTCSERLQCEVCTRSIYC